MNKVFINDRPIYFVENATGLDSSLIVPFDGISSIELAIKKLSNISAPQKLYLLVKDSTETAKFLISKLLYIEAAGGLVKNADGNYLFILRHGKWDLPKGKAEPGESIEETALREVEEECGISPLQIVKNLHNTYHIYALKGWWALKCTHWYLMQYNGNQQLVPQTAESITDVQWVKPANVDALMRNSYETIKLVVREEISIA